MGSQAELRAVWPGGAQSIRKEGYRGETAARQGKIGYNAERNAKNLMRKLEVNYLLVSTLLKYVSLEVRVVHFRWQLEKKLV